MSNVGKNGQKYYVPMYNYIEAKNNDGVNPLNKATFSTDLIIKLLDMYLSNSGGVVYDCFMGTGTTAYACRSKGLDYVGSEISEAQVEYANQRLKSIQTTLI